MRNAKLILAIVALSAIILLVTQFDLQILSRRALERIASLGTWGPVLFVVIYVLACVLFLPGWLLTLGAGAIFGLVRGSIIVSIAATLGAATAFLVGRYLARDLIAQKLDRYPRFKAIDEAVAREGWKIVGLTRLSPAFPFNLLNYAFGLTQVSFWEYVLASWIGMLPGALLYVYVGSLAGDLTKLGPTERTRTPVEWALYAVGFVATVFVTVLVTRLAKRALGRRIDG